MNKNKIINFKAKNTNNNISLFKITTLIDLSFGADIKLNHN